MAEIQMRVRRGQEIRALTATELAERTRECYEAIPHATINSVSANAPDGNIIYFNLAGERES